MDDGVAGVEAGHDTLCRIKLQHSTEVGSEAV